MRTKCTLIDMVTMNTVSEYLSLFILFGFIKNLASHLGRSPLIHSDYYESAGDHPICLARFPINSKSSMQYAG